MSVSGKKGQDWENKLLVSIVAAILGLIIFSSIAGVFFMKEFASHSQDATIATLNGRYSANLPTTTITTDHPVSYSASSSSDSTSSTRDTTNTHSNSSTSTLPSKSTILASTSTSSSSVYETSSSHSGTSDLIAGVNFAYTTSGSQNSIQVTVGINDTGGRAPFTFTAHWSDGVTQVAYWSAGPNQTNGDGIFIRSFTSNQDVPSTVNVLVQSSDGQSTTVYVNVPPVSGTSSS